MSKTPKKTEAEKASQGVTVREEVCTEYLRYEFTEEEVKDKGEEMAQAVKDKESAEAELENIRTQIKHRISVADGKIKLNSEHIRSGYEMRTTKCRRVFDMEADTVITIRADTDVVVLSRALTEEERQFQLSLDDGPPAQEETETPF